MHLIAVDLDGTLLRSDKTVSERTAEALRQARARGFTVVPVTARPPRFLRRVALDCEIFDMAICCNGALVFDVPGEKIIEHHALEPADALRIVALLREALPDICFAAEMGLRYGWDSRYASLPGALLDPDGILAEVDGLLTEPVTKLIARHPSLAFELLLESARALAMEDCEITHSSTEFIEISRRGVDKAAALIAFTARLGLSPSDVIAFGDMPNDLPMLRWAGHSIAVANAHPDVLSTVDAVTASNDEDGVAVMLERMLQLSPSRPSR